MKLARTALDALVAVLLAPSCAVCGASLEYPTTGPVCGRCWAAIVPTSPPLCDNCGDPLQSWRVISADTGRCARCRRTASALSSRRAIGEYAGTLRQILHALKYGRRRSLARPLAAMLRRHGSDLLQGDVMVVPVPLHRRRRRSRGFNQAAELARHLGFPVCHALRRVRATHPQTDLPAGRRHANVRGAFALARRTSVRGTCVVLVDDISTTGATLEACARVLREAGARDVRALTAARVATRPPR